MLKNYFTTALRHIALPSAFWLMNLWLQQLAYRAGMNGMLFVGVTIISIVLVIVSAGHSSWKAGLMNPVDVIKRDS